MEREVARVAAACDLRAFRYLPFPGIEFDPLPLQAEPVPKLVPEAAIEPAPSAAALSIPIPPEPAAAPPPEPEPIAPPPTPLPPLRPDIFRQDRPDWDVPEPPPRQAAPAPRYRMLEDLAIEPPAPRAERPAERPTERPLGHRPAARAAMPALSGAGGAAQPPPPAPSAGAPMVPPSRGPNPLPRGPRPRRAWPR